MTPRDEARVHIDLGSNEAADAKWLLEPECALDRKSPSLSRLAEATPASEDP